MLKLLQTIRKLRVLLMVTGMLFSGVVNAADISWFPKTAGDGFTVMTPTINTDLLIEDLAVYKADLAKKQRLLAAKVEQKRVTGGDNVLSLLMPGGLLYAAYKRDAYSRAVEQHDITKHQYEEISNELSRFRSITPTTVVLNR